MAYSQYLDELILKWLGRNTDLPGAPNNVFLSLHAADPGETGASELDTAIGAYARKSVSCGDAGTGANGGWTTIGAGGAGERQLSNNAEVAFAAATANWNGGSNITHFGIWDAAEGPSLGSITVTDTTDRVNLTSHGLSADEAIRFKTTGTLPGGLLTTAIYYVLNPTANDFQVKTTLDGSAFDITTAAGSGTHTVYRAGNFLGGGALAVAKPVLNGDIARYPASSFVIKHS
jgi:hypothetical protein